MGDLWVKILVAIASGLVLFWVAQVVALIVVHMKMMHELAFIKGQVTHFVRGVDKVEDLARTLAVLDRAQIKTAMDVDHAFQKIRSLQGDGCNGSGIESA